MFIVSEKPNQKCFMIELRIMRWACNRRACCQTLCALQVPVPANMLEQSENVPARIAPQGRSASVSPNSSDAEGRDGNPSSMDPSTAEGGRSSEEGPPGSGESYLETLHFFGVFDGHGGAEAALHCAQTLHQRIAEALAATVDPGGEEEQTGPGEERSCLNRVWSTVSCKWDHLTRSDPSCTCRTWEKSMGLPVVSSGQVCGRMPVGSCSLSGGAGDSKWGPQISCCRQFEVPSRCDFESFDRRGEQILSAPRDRNKCA